MEINDGYLEAIRHYPAVAGILSNPKVAIQIDDGRRWMRRNPEARFDVIVMNTTVHWRAFATLLLSREFMTILARHLAPGGIATYNSTDSPDSFATAAAVFPFARRYENFVYVGDRDFVVPPAEIERRLLAAEALGLPLLDAADPAVRDAVARLAETPFVTLDEVARATGRPLEIVTDRNMITEYRHSPAWASLR